MRVRQSVAALQWLAYISRTRNNVTYAGNGRQAHLSGVPMWRLTGIMQRRGKSLNNLGAFGMGVDRQKPIGNTGDELRDSVLHCYTDNYLHSECRWTPKSKKMWLSGSPQKRVVVFWLWLLYSRICFGWPKELCVFCFLPLDRKT